MLPAEHTLWYDRPASEWLAALPLGNGRLGAMVFGRVSEERIQLNEDTVWAGGPIDRHHAQTARLLPKIRELLFAGKLNEASYLTRMAMTSGPKHLQPYQSLGELVLAFREPAGVLPTYGMMPDSTGVQVFGRIMGPEIADYRRQLDLTTGIADTSFTWAGVAHRREALVSYPDQVVAIRLTAAAPGRLTFNASLFRRPFDPGTITLAPNRRAMRGQCGADGVHFATVLQVIPDGGSLTTIGDFITIEDADAATILITVATSFRDPDPLAAAEARNAAAAQRGYAEIRTRHLADHAALYQRVDFALAGSGSSLPTDRRLRAFRSDPRDLGLIALLGNYGRYLLIASSRPGSLPANLQGRWNDSFTPAWEAKYTININLQMNYWPAEICALGECHEPLFDFLDRLVDHGRITAQKLYGCRGFVAHHNTGLWAETTPEGISMLAAIWPMGGAWLSLHLWEHYQFSEDRDFLARRGQPVLAAAARFLADFVVRSPTGHLVSGPSVSPENWYRLPSGEEGALCMSPAMDTQIIRAVWRACIAACALLDRDQELALELSHLLPQLPPDRIGSQGQLLEWQEEYAEAEPGHRHLSHLFALCPDSDITPTKTPAFAAAAATTLQRRKAGRPGPNTGWSTAWETNCWARLGNGEAAWASILEFCTHSVLGNLFCTHPPFQIDGNFGITAGLVEMLVQSHAGVIALLPAVPKAWATGRITGIRARGGITVDLHWHDGAIERLILIADATTTVHVQVPSGTHLRRLDGGAMTAEATGFSVSLIAKTPLTFAAHAANRAP